MVTPLTAAALDEIEARVTLAEQLLRHPHPIVVSPQTYVDLAALAWDELLPTDVPRLIRALRASQARVAELRKYATHAPRCDSLERYSGGMLTRGPCNCGLDAALKETT